MLPARSKNKPEGGKPTTLFCVVSFWLIYCTVAWHFPHRRKWFSKLQFHFSHGLTTGLVTNQNVSRCPVWWPPSRMYVAPSVECCWSNRENNEAKTRNPLKFAGCPKLANRSQPLVGRSHTILWGHVEEWCLTSFSSDCRHMPWLRRYSPTRWCADGDFLRPVFQRAVCSTFQRSAF